MVYERSSELISVINSSLGDIICGLPQHRNLGAPGKGPGQRPEQFHYNSHLEKKQHEFVNSEELDKIYRAVYNNCISIDRTEAGL